ncbi:MAG: hypothetical protein V2A78_03960 [bacterium]
MSQDNLLPDGRKVLVETSPEFKAWIRAQECKSAVRKEEESRKEFLPPPLEESVPLSGPGSDRGIRGYNRFVNAIIMLVLAGCVLLFGFISSYYNTSIEKSSSQKFRHPLSLRVYDSRTRDLSLLHRHLKPQGSPPIEDHSYYIPEWPKPLPLSPVPFEMPVPPDESPDKGMPAGRLNI